MITALAVLVRIVANPVSNLFQKKLTQRSADPLFVVCATHALLTLACVPAMLAGLELEAPGPFWADMTCAALLAVLGNTLLVHALRSTDLSILGPVNAYKSVIGLLLGMALIGEVPTPAGAGGVALVLIGSYFVVEPGGHRSRHGAFALFFRDRGIQLRLLALLCSAAEAVFLKRALQHSSPLTTFVLWAAMGLPIAAVAVGVQLRGEARVQAANLVRHRATYLLLAATTGLMQLTTLLTFQRLQVGYSLALFQTSALVSVFLGHRYLQETSIARKLIGALVMMAGAMLIVAYGAGA